MDVEMVAVNCAECGREIKGRPGKLPYQKVKGRPHCGRCMQSRNSSLVHNYGRVLGQATKLGMSTS